MNKKLRRVLILICFGLILYPLLYSIINRATNLFSSFSSLLGFLLAVYIFVIDPIGENPIIEEEE